MHDQPENSTSYGIWLKSYREPQEFFDEAEARRRHDAGERYFVWWGEPDSPNLLMEVDHLGVGAVEVMWLDDHNRWTDHYLFVPATEDAAGGDDQRLFLSQVRYRTLPEFDPNNPRAGGNSAVTFFKRDGSAHHERVVDGVVESMDTPALLHDEAEHLLFEPRPAFGDWARITRPDRDK